MPGRKPTSWWRITLAILTAPIWLSIAALLIVAMVVCLPWAFLLSLRDSRSFTHRFRSEGRTVRWTDALAELQRGQGILLVECFSHGPARRLWWFRRPLPLDCPLPAYGPPLPRADLLRFLQHDPAVQQWTDEHLLPCPADLLLITNAPSRWRQHLPTMGIETRQIWSHYLARILTPPAPRGFEPRLTSPTR